ncbi:hypothetical protein KIPB_006088, partial [Kipferlia bialata]|eukprot:g6088.t1
MSCLLYAISLTPQRDEGEWTEEGESPKAKKKAARKTPAKRTPAKRRTKVQLDSDSEDEVVVKKERKRAPAKRRTQPKVEEDDFSDVNRSRLTDISKLVNHTSHPYSELVGSLDSLWSQGKGAEVLFSNIDMVREAIEEELAPKKSAARAKAAKRKAEEAAAQQAEAKRRPAAKEEKSNSGKLRLNEDHPVPTLEEIFGEDDVPYAWWKDIDMAALQGAAGGDDSDSEGESDDEGDEGEGEGEGEKKAKKGKVKKGHYHKTLRHYGIAMAPEYEPYHTPLTVTVGGETHQLDMHPE